MNVWQRAGRSVWRKPVKSMLLLLAVSAISLLIFIRDGKQDGEYCGKGQHQTGDRGRISYGNECGEQE